MLRAALRRRPSATLNATLFSDRLLTTIQSNQKDSQMWFKTFLAFISEINSSVSLYHEPVRIP